MSGSLTVAAMDFGFGSQSNQTPKVEPNLTTQGITVRTHYNTSESNADFIGESSDCTKIEFDVKALEGNAKKPFDQQIKDIISNIQKDIENLEDPSKF